MSPTGQELLYTTLKGIAFLFPGDRVKHDLASGVGSGVIASLMRMSDFNLSSLLPVIDERKMDIILSSLGSLDDLRDRTQMWSKLNKDGSLNSWQVLFDRLDFLQNVSPEKMQLSDWTEFRGVVRALVNLKPDRALGEISQVMDQKVLGQLSWWEKIAGVRITQDRVKEIKSRVKLIGLIIDDDKQLSCIRRSLQSNDAKELALYGYNNRDNYLRGQEGQIVRATIDAFGMRVSPYDSGRMEMSLGERWVPAPAIISPDPEVNWLRTLRREVQALPCVDSFRYMDEKQVGGAGSRESMDKILKDIVLWHLRACHGDWVSLRREFLSVVPESLIPQTIYDKYDGALDSFEQLISPKTDFSNLPSAATINRLEDDLLGIVQAWATGIVR